MYHIDQNGLLHHKQAKQGATSTKERSRKARDIEKIVLLQADIHRKDEEKKKRNNKIKHLYFNARHELFHSRFINKIKTPLSRCPDDNRRTNVKIAEIT